MKNKLQYFSRFYETYNLGKSDIITINYNGTQVKVEVVENYGNSVLVEFMFPTNNTNASHREVISYDDIVCSNDKNILSIDDIAQKPYKSLWNF